MIWLAGACGLLGSSVGRAFDEAGLSWIGTGREVDISEAAAVAGFGEGRSIRWVVNCAAYTDVDRAELEPARCRRVNVEGAGNLARWAQQTGAAIIHISSDYVFSGNETKEYKEEDPTAPINVYGVSKAEGEVLVRSECPRHYILRTSWLYGASGRNFVTSILGKLNAGIDFGVVSDQRGSPTWTADLARLVVDLIRRGGGAWGTYHASDEGECSRYEFALLIREIAVNRGLVDRVPIASVKAIGSNELTVLATRPSRTSLSKRKLSETFGWSFPPWQQSLKAYLEDLPVHRPTCLLVTGGAGFIGSHFVRHVFLKTSFEGNIINFDKLTYAGKRENLVDIEEAFGDRYHFVRGDVADPEAVDAVLAQFDVDTVVHFAAESHVDRSIEDPDAFLRTNVWGTYTLLQAVRRAWGGRTDVRFHHVSTDEVFGSLGESGLFQETSPYDPHSPYSASKAASDHLVRAWYRTYGIAATLSHSSNNYGPGQFPEKLIPRILANLKDGKPLPIYGDGKNVRDWIHVEDHTSALWAIVTRGREGEAYNIGGGNERTNLELVQTLCRLWAQSVNKKPEDLLRLITFVGDRPGHDRRYALDVQKIQALLGWFPVIDFEVGLELTLYKTL